jgi:hypothetical protein
VVPVGFVASSDEAAMPKASGEETCIMVANILATTIDLVANVLPFGATSPFDPSGSTGVQKLQVGGIASPPAPTFSIWGIIFGWQIVFLVAQFCSPCNVSRADVMKVSQRMIVAHLAQTCYGLVIYLVPGKGTCLILATIVITVALFAFLHLQSLLNEYKFGTFFWLTFGYGINCGWLVVATYVQFSSLLVYNSEPALVSGNISMNQLQIPLLILTVLVYCFLSLNPGSRNPPVYFCVSLWTFSFQALLWAPQKGADENFTEGVQTAYRIIVAIAAFLSLPGAIYIFRKKASDGFAEDGFTDVPENSSAD